MPNRIRKKVKVMGDQVLTWPIYSWDKPWNEIKFDLIREDEWQSPGTIQGVGMTLNSEQQIIEYLRNKGFEVDVPSPVNMNTRITELEQRIEAIENRTSLLSPNFFMRAFSVLGLYLFAIAIVGIGVALVIVVIGAAGG